MTRGPGRLRLAAQRPAVYVALLLAVAGAFALVHALRTGMVVVWVVAGLFFLSSAIWFVVGARESGERPETTGE